MDEVANNHFENKFVIQKKNDITAVFLRFLTKNHILSKYLTALHKANYGTERSFLNSYWSPLTDPESYIGSAFPWECTPEGRDFWINKHHLWVKELNKFKNR